MFYAPHPHKKNKHSFYRRVTSHFASAQSYAESYSGNNPDANFYKRRLQLIDKLLNNFYSGSVLDIGCGPGKSVPLILDRGLNFVGVDITPEMVAECRREHIDDDRVKVVVGNCEKLPFDNDAFSAVLALGVIEYVQGVEAAFSEMSRVLKPNGTMLISMLNKWSPYRLWEKHVYIPVNSSVHAPRKRNEAPAMKTLSGRKIKRLLEREGCQVLSVSYYDFNIVFRPYDSLYPRIYHFFIDLLEERQIFILRWLGSAFIVKAQKGCPQDQIFVRPRTRTKSFKWSTNVTDAPKLVAD